MQELIRDSKQRVSETVDMGAAEGVALDCAVRQSVFCCLRYRRRNTPGRSSCLLRVSRQTAGAGSSPRPLLAAPMLCCADLTCPPRQPPQIRQQPAGIQRSYEERQLSLLGPKIAIWEYGKGDRLNVCRHLGKTLRQGSIIYGQENSHKLRGILTGRLTPNQPVPKRSRRARGLCSLGSSATLSTFLGRGLS